MDSGSETVDGSHLARHFEVVASGTVCGCWFTAPTVVQRTEWRHLAEGRKGVSRTDCLNCLKPGSTRRALNLRKGWNNNLAQRAKCYFLKLVRLSSPSTSERPENRLRISFLKIWGLPLWSAENAKYCFLICFKAS